MKRLHLYIIVFVLCSFFAPTVFASIPTSPKAQGIIDAVTPKLMKQVRLRGFDWGAPVFIRIFKKNKELEVWLKDKEEFKLFRKYKICRFAGGFGPKLRAGDHQSPEGFYEVTPSQLNPYSNYHLSFNLGFPNPYDRIFGRTGSALMVHGACGSRGCFAMNNQQIEEIYALVDAGLRNGQESFQVQVFPFRLNQKNLKRHRNSEWYSFWLNLKEGYDYFEQKRQPPTVVVAERKYVFR